jgi:D-alanyl-D-alanine carboxypeptidase
MKVSHSFDWEGCSLAVLLVIAGLAVCILTYAGLSFATSKSPNGAAAPIIVRESTTTPERIISALTVKDAVPQSGKFIAADLSHMTLTLYQDGEALAQYPILTKGRPGSPYETPSGNYSVLYKEPDHFNKKEKVHMPFSMQFYGNYFIHGWPYYEDGTPVASTYSGGCIRLSTDDAEKVYDFADRGTGLFVYDPIYSVPEPSLVLAALPPPPISAASYLVADVDTGDVSAEQEPGRQMPIASLTKLMTALVANETIMFNDSVTVSTSELLHTQTASSTGTEESFSVGDLLYPLLMESNNAIADRLAEFHGSANFVSWMNTTAKALNMQSTRYADASGVSAQNVSTTDDLYRLSVYLANKKSFIWDITRTPTKELVADSGNVYRFTNFNLFADSPDFVGGKVGKTGAAQETMLSVFTVPVNGVPRRIAIVVLKSEDYGTDTKKLSDWFQQSSAQGVALANTACTSCPKLTKFRKIKL